MDELERPSGFFIRAGAMMRTGFKLSVRDVAPPPPSASGMYDDGFVLPSISGADADKTWNWGYSDAAQISGDHLTLQRLNQAPRVGTLGADESTLGGEVVMGFEVTRFDIGKRSLSFGMEAGYGYSSLSASMAGVQSGSATLTTARHGLGGIQPPGAPYAGTFAGPGPLINLQPSEMLSGSALGTQTLSVQIDSAVHMLRVGPYFDFHLNDKLNLGLSLGYASILPSTEMVLRETTTYGSVSGGGPGPQESTQSGRYRRTDWQPGGYVQLRAQYNFTQRWGAFAGLDYSFHETLRFQGGGRQFQLGMGSLLGGIAGVRIGF